MSLVVKISNMEIKIKDSGIWVIVVMLFFIATAMMDIANNIGTLCK